MNDAIFYFFYNLAHQSNFFDHLVVFFGLWFPYITLLLAGLFLVFHHDLFSADNPYQVFLKKKKEILPIFFSLILAWLGAEILKILVHTPRPFLALPNIHTLFPETGFSFPSIHATVFSALAFSLFFTHKKAGYVFMIFALIIGMARIIAGVHFPADILGGFVLGGAVAYLVAYFAKKL